MRNRLVTVTLIVLSIVTILSFFGSSGARTYYVDDDPIPWVDHHTIQAAIDAAEYGDTIFVFGGNYEETLTMKEGIKLLGDPKDPPFMEGVNLTDDGDGRVFIKPEDDIWIEGFHFNNSDRVILNGAHTNVTFYRNRFTFQNWSAIHNYNGAETYIANNIFLDINYAVYSVKGATSPNPANDTIINNVFDDCYYGIYGPSGIQRILNNIFFECHYAIRSADHDETVVDHNLFWNNTHDHSNSKEGEHDLVGDPKFIDDEYHISMDSHASENGTVNLTSPHDLDGTIRVIDSDMNGTASVEIGPYEIQPTIVVDDDNGSWAVYDNIGDAVEVAPRGCIIRIYDGLYPEIVEVDEALTLIGNSSDTVTIEGDYIDSVIEILSDDVTIQRVTVKEGNQDSLFYAGINISDRSNVTVKGCRIFDTKFGVRLENSINCLVENCVFNETSTAIRFQKGGSHVVNNCELRDIDGTGIWIGTYATHVRVTHAEIINATAGLGITNNDGHHKVANIRINRSRDTGLGITWSPNNTFSNCTSSYSTKYGLSFGADCEDLAFYDSTFFNNSWPGASFYLRRNILFRNCSFFNNPSRGIRCGENEQIIFDRCSIYDNGVEGVAIRDSREFMFINSSIGPNDGPGIVAENATIVLLNTTISSVDCDENSTIFIDNHLHIKVRNGSGPTEGADVRIKDNDEVIYSTVDFGGTDASTDQNGTIEWIVVTDRAYLGANTSTQNDTLIEVKYGSMSASRYVNMSSSHIEVFKLDSEGSAIFVDDDNAGDPSMNGSKDHPYDTIERAMDNSTDGDTIRVHNGTYYENVVVWNTISLIGNGSSDTIIDGGENNIVVEIIKDDVNISGFTVRNSIVSGEGLLTSGNNTIIEDIYATDNKYGIRVQDCRNAIVRYCNASENLEQGIFLGYATNASVYNNSAAMNPGAGGRGIYLSRSDNCTVSNNTVWDNGWTGIFAYLSENITIDNNVVNGHDTNDDRGINLRDSNYNYIHNNTCYLNNWNIFLYTSKYNVVENNTLYESDDDHLVIYDRSNYNTIQYNTLSNASSGGKGVHVEANCDSNEIVWNLIQDNHNYGVSFWSSSCNNNDVHHNRFIDNGGSTQGHDAANNNDWDDGEEGNWWSDYIGDDDDRNGIGDTPYDVTGSTAQDDDYPLLDVIIVDDDWAGADYDKIQDALDAAKEGDLIYVYEGTYYEDLDLNTRVILSGNSSTNTTVDAQNSEHPIEINADYTEVSGLAFTGSGTSRSGVKIDADHCHVHHNRVYENSDPQGININGDFNLVEYNLCDDNDGNGIRSYLANNNTIHMNTIKGNGKNGIYIQSSSDCIVTDNIIEDHDGSEGNGIRIFSSTRTIATGNNISDSINHGIYVSGSDNQVYLNWLEDNNEGGTQGTDYGTNTSWDNGTLGNYWSDYDGSDTNRDGIGDSPYEVDGTGSTDDNYPIWDVIVPATFTVDDDWAGADFSTIYDALDFVLDGDTIRVHAGAYRENVDVDKKVKIIGNGSDDTIHRGDGSGELMSINVNGVEISNMTFAEAMATFPAIMIYGNNTVVKFCLFTTGTNADAIELQGRKNVVHSNIFNYSGANGLFLDSASETSVYNNTFRKNNDIAIKVRHGDNNTIFGNDIHNNTVGIRLEDTDTAVVQGNDIHNNTDYGIHVAIGTTDASVYNNSFFNNEGAQGNGRDDGTDTKWTKFGGGNYWSDYEGLDNNSDGIGDTPHLLFGNSGSRDSLPIVITLVVDDDWAGADYEWISDALDSGRSNHIRVYAGYYNEIIDVDRAVLLLGNGTESTIIDGDHSTTALTLSADYIRVNGFNVTNGAASGYGIEIAARYCTVEDSEVHGNTGGGILISSDYNLVQNCSVSYNEDFGIEVDGDRNNISGNRIEENWAGGVWVQDGNFNEIYNNTVHRNNYTTTENSGAGIRLSVTSVSIVSYNNISYHLAPGIFFDEDSSNCEAHNNWLQDNGDGSDQAMDNGTSNDWDNGSVGNYWSDYDGIDGDRDGIGDTPHFVGGSSGQADRYPIWNIAAAVSFIVDDDWAGADFTSIQDALDSARPGDNVTVHAGTYNEKIKISKTVRLIGNGSANTTIFGNALGDTVQVNASGSELAGFTITNSGNLSWKAGIKLLKKDCHIHDNNITGNFVGIALSEAENNTIEYNNIYANYQGGIEMYSSAENMIWDNVITDTYVNGILISDCTDDDINGNTIVNHTTGLDIEYSSGVRVYNNNISLGTNGIRITESDDVRMDGNNWTFFNIGIQAVDSQDLYLGQGTISYCGLGTDLNNDDNVTIEGNLFYQNSDTGLYVMLGSDYWIEGNAMFENDGAGSLCNLIDGLTFTDNEVHNNRDGGLEVYWTDDIMIVDNHLFNNSIFGMVLDHTYNASVLSNNIDHSRDALSVKVSDRTRIFENNITSSDGSGIVIKGGDPIKVYGNYVEAYDSGLELQYVEDSTVHGNRFIGCGISIEGNELRFWEGNQISWNNSVNGMTVVVYWGVTYDWIDEEAGQVIVIDCVNINITGVEVNSSTHGILLGYCRNVDLHELTLFNNTRAGVRAHNVTELNIYSSSMTNNSAGLHLTNVTNLFANDTDIRTNTNGTLLDHGNTNITFNYTNYIGNRNGLMVLDGENSNISVHLSAYKNSVSYGIRNLDPNQIDARYCEWGHSTGPYHDPDNKKGKGDEIAGNVVFKPLGASTNVAPTVNITAPVDGSDATDSTSINGTSADPDGLIEWVEVKISSSAWAMATGTDSWTYTWTPTSFTPGTITIQARSWDGEEYSETASIDVNITAQVPSEPRYLKATAQFNYIYLSWDAPADSGSTSVTSYLIYRGTASGIGDQIGAVNDVRAYSITYIDKTPVTDTVYYYRVKAVSETGTSDFSSEVSAKIEAKKTTGPTSPGDEEDSFLSKLTEEPMYLGIILVVILVLIMVIVMVVMRRRSPDETEQSPGGYVSYTEEVGPEDEYYDDQGPPAPRPGTPPPPSHARDGPPPPRHMDDSPPPPAHMRDGPPPPGHVGGSPPPPKHIRGGSTPSRQAGAPPPPKHIREGAPPRRDAGSPPPPSHMRDGPPPPSRLPGDMPPTPPRREPPARTPPPPRHVSDGRGPSGRSPPPPSRLPEGFRPDDARPPPKRKRAPPPPPKLPGRRETPPQPGADPGSSICPRCGGPARWIESYSGWFCDKCDRYVDV